MRPQLKLKIYIFRGALLTDETNFITYLFNPRGSLSTIKASKADEGSRH